MQPRINHQPTDRNKARWKSVALFALIGFWLLSGVVGRDPWKPEPVYIGILQSLLQQISGGGHDWWTPSVAGVAQDGEIILIHWLNAPLILLAKLVLPLHEAARISSIVWAAFGIASIALAARRWSGGHISFLAAIITIGCIGLYDRAHSYVPDIAVFAATAFALYGAAELATAPRRATALFTAAIVIAFAGRSALGFVVVALPVLLLCFAPVFSMHRVALVRALVFSTVICGFWIVAFALRDPTGFDGWIDADFGLKLEDRARFGPTSYLSTLLWFAWPAWPIAVWLITLRVRGFGGGWQRGEVVAPVVFFVSGFVVISLLTEPRDVHALYLLPPLIVLASFGVDTLKRTWYALIDWFGILVLGITALAAVLAASAVYYGWPPRIAEWLTGYVPGFKGPQPWLGYAVALLAFVIWIALIQPAHQHARRALINWAGCVTFLWVVAQALLLAPANYISTYRGVFSDLAKAWPQTGCVNSIELSTSQAAMLSYYISRETEPVDAAVEAQCKFVLLQRYRGQPIPLPEPEFKLRYRGNRPGDNFEAFELYERTDNALHPNERTDESAPSRVEGAKTP
jgi:4-amino-4-deoxy-L-arabinose transferase-like glycosyltransferase